MTASQKHAIDYEEAEMTDQKPLDIAPFILKDEEIAALTAANQSFVKFFKTIVSFTAADLSRYYSKSNALSGADSIDREIKRLDDKMITLEDMTLMANTLARRLTMSSDFARMLEYIQTDDNMAAIWEQLMTMMRLMESTDE